MKRYITIATIISAFAVVGLHVNNFWTFRYSNDWVMANFVECFFYFAVPVFFMITGVTLIDYKQKYSTKVYFEKRFKKIVIPLITWNVIACIVQKIFFELDFNIFSLFSWIDGIVNSRFIDYYWFFNAIIIVYLTIPLLSEVNHKVKHFVYCIMIYFSFSVLFPMIFNCFNISYSDNLYFQIGTGLSVYSMLGYVLDKIKFTKKQLLIIYLLGVLGFSIHFFGTWYLSYQSGEINRLFKDYLSLPCLLYSMAVFVFFKDVLGVIIQDKLFEKIKSLSNLSFGIYLVQYFFIEIVQFVWEGLYTNFLTRLVGALIVFVLSAILVWIIKRIPYIKRLVP